MATSGAARGNSMLMQNRGGCARFLLVPGAQEPPGPSLVAIAERQSRAMAPGH